MWIPPPIGNTPEVGLNNLCRMKKIFSFTMLAVAAMAAFSCKQEINVDEAAASVKAPKVVTAYTDADVTPSSKTSLDGVTILWSSSDVVKAYSFDGDVVSSTSTAISEGGKKAEFTFAGLDASADIYMYAYPADAVTSMDGNNNVVYASIPTEQMAVAGSFADGANLAVAEGGDDPVFRNVGGLLSFTIKNDNIVSVKLSANEVLTGGSAEVLVCDDPIADVTGGEMEVVISDASAPLANGSTYYAVVYPGTYTGLQLVFTDATGRTATYSNPNTLTVNRNANLKVWDMAIADGKWVNPVVSLVDDLDNPWTGISGTSYVAKNDLNGSASDAVYSVQAAGGNTAIQLRSNNSNSGIVTTASGGKLKSITVKWNSNTAAARVLDVYAKNTAYSAPSDLYGSNKGDKVASFTCSDGDGSYTFTSDYEFIGIRSNDGALYLDKIQIEWLSTPPKADPEISYNPTSATITYGETLTQPTLNNPYGLTVSYASNSTDVATVATNGVISVEGVGTATITCSWDEQTISGITYRAGSATYALTVQSATNDGSFEHPYTASEAAALAKSGDTDSYYITGIVTKIQNQFNASYGTANFWIDENGSSTSVFEGYKIKYFNNQSWVDGNAEISLNDNVIIYGALSMFNTTAETSSGYLVQVNGKAGLTLPTVTTTLNDANKQITVTWDAVTGSAGTVTYTVSCDSQEYVATAAGSHTFTMADYGEFAVSVVASADDAWNSIVNTSATLTDPNAVIHYYNKVSSITVNKKYLIVSGGGNRVLVPSTGSGRKNSEEVTVDDTNERIVSTASIDAFAVTIIANKSNTSYYDITFVKSGTTYYLQYDSSTSLNTDTSSSSTKTWNVAAGTHGTFRFADVSTASATTKRGLVFRAGSSNMFGAYSLGNINGTEYYDIDLYEYDD